MQKKKKRSRGTTYAGERCMCICLFARSGEESYFWSGLSSRECQAVLVWSRWKGVSSSLHYLNSFVYSTFGGFEDTRSVLDCQWGGLFGWVVLARCVQVKYIRYFLSKENGLKKLGDVTVVSSSFQIAGGGMLSLVNMGWHPAPRLCCVKYCGWIFALVNSSHVGSMTAQHRIFRNRGLFTMEQPGNVVLHV